MVNVDLQAPAWLLLSKSASSYFRQGAEARGASRFLWLLLAGESSLKFPEPFSFLGAASSAAINFCLQTHQSIGQWLPNPFIAQTKVSTSSHLNQHQILFPVHSLLKETLHLGPVFLLKPNKENWLTKKVIYFNFRDLSSRDWVMLHLQERIWREAGFWQSLCITVLTLSFNHTGPNFTCDSVQVLKHKHIIPAGMSRGDHTSKQKWDFFGGILFMSVCKAGVSPTSGSVMLLVVLNTCSQQGRAEAWAAHLICSISHL